MKTKLYFPRIAILFFLISLSISAQEKYTSYKGLVINQQTEEPVVSAKVEVENHDFSTVTNNEGEFTLKIPVDLTNAIITTSYLGYDSKSLHLRNFDQERTLIQLIESSEKLSEINLYQVKDAKSLVKECFSKRGENYINHSVVMSGFYRETIQKGRRNVSLSEAVIKIHKESYTSNRRDKISILKARKSTDYSRLDTLALKLRGGPYSSLYLDVMEYPEFLFEDEQLSDYSFTLENPTSINNRYVHQVSFEENSKGNAWYNGTLYIDAATLTLLKADYNLTIENRKLASRMFVVKKPGSVKVYPEKIQYHVNYFEKDGKWYYGHSNAMLEFVINWKKKLFNSRYTLTNEMIVTKREEIKDKQFIKPNYIKPSIVMTDDVSGFKDENFWGASNIIEPEKSIQNAIEKIKANLD